PVPGTRGPDRFIGRPTYFAHDDGRGGKDTLIEEADINSAYPDAITNLMCWEHATYEHRIPGEDELGIVHVHARYPHYDYEADVFTSIEYPYLMAFPHRSVTGKISRPLEVIGWYWNHEVREARHQDVMKLDGWTIVNDCDCD